MKSSSATNPERGEIRRSRPLLGTFVEIRAVADDVATVNTAVNRAFTQIARVQALMSPFEPTSDVTRINVAAPQQNVRVHAWTWRVLVVAQALSRETHGAFDVTAGAGTAGGWRDLELRSGRRVCCRRRLRVDLGGIAKGFAVDRAIDALRTAGVRAGVVNAGGDLRVFGPDAEPIWIRHPAALDCGVWVGNLRNGACATSANYLDQRGRGRLRNPARGRLWIGRGSVSVQARTCVMADALTKVVAGLGPQRSVGILRRYSATTLTLSPDGFVSTEDGERATCARPRSSEEVRHAA